MEDSKKIIVFLLLLGIVLISGCTKTGYLTEYNQVDKDVIIIKSSSEMLPKMGDLSTEWVFKDLEKSEINSTGFEEGNKISFHKGSQGDYRVATYAYRFSSIENAKNYYQSTIEDDKTLSKGGYKEIPVSKIGTECTGYVRETWLVDKYTLYCVKNNIFFEVSLDSLSFNGEEYVIEVAKIIDSKIN